MRLLGPFSRGAEAIDSARQCELGSAEAGDEVAAPDPARVLHRLQDPVRRGKAAADSLRAHDLAGQDAVSLEKLPDLGGGALRQRDRCIARRLGATLTVLGSLNGFRATRDLLA